MPRRFTDTDKWKDEWWGSLSNDYRMIWLYLVDSCSIAGIWKKDFRGLNFNCNTKITEDEFVKVFGSRVIDKGNFFFIPKFLRYQNPKGLNSNKPAIISIVKELQLNNLIQTVNESLGNDYLIIKGIGKGKGIGMVYEKEREQKDEEKKFSDDWFSEVFDDIMMGSIASTFPNHDLKNELGIFKLKVRGSPKDYGHRDTGGIRQAFIYQLKNSTSINGNGTSNSRGQAKSNIRRADAILEEGKDFGTL